MDISLFRDSADMARWALLHSEARVTIDMSVVSDTIVTLALDPYTAKGRWGDWLRVRKCETSYGFGSDGKSGCTLAVAVAREGAGVCLVPGV